MKALLKMILKRIKSKNPKFFNILAYIAGVLLTLFFGADNLLDLPLWLCQFSEIIYTVLITIIGLSQLPIADSSKHAGKNGTNR